MQIGCTAKKVSHFYFSLRCKTWGFLYLCIAIWDFVQHFSIIPDSLLPLLASECQGIAEPR